MDLKWLSEQADKIKELLHEFWASHSRQVEDRNIPPELLTSHFEVLQALANYQIALLEQQRRRHGYIQSETDMQEMMSNLENIVKNFREQEK